MVKAATVVGLLFAAAVTHLACSPFGGANAFPCTQDSECAGTDQGQTSGRCVAGFCAFPDDTCSSGDRYGSLAGSLSGQCVGGDVPADGPTDSLPPDGPPPDPEDVCFGAANGFVKPCFAPADVPSNAIVLDAPIDTDGGQCSTTVKAAPGLCVIAGTTINVTGVVTVTGSKPLVLLSVTGAITIDGTLDGASHIATPNLKGPAADDGTCDPGTAPNVSGGGGAGGSFGGTGGNGGDGQNVANSRGVAGAAAATVNNIRGGCRGQDGADNTVAATKGIGGHGGGALYLIGKTSITLNATGVINASGAAATGGAANSNGAGGGGGGSGGLIGLDAPALANAGNIFTNGGGGGEGAGQMGIGGNGTDPTTTTVGTGGAIGFGGDGGNGGVANNGVGGTSSSRGGGGGGGGTGVIKLFGGATDNGTIDPAPN